MSYRSYDQSLLANAPAVSRAEKQEGYDVDLLDERHRPISQNPLPNGARSALDSGHNSKENLSYVPHVSPTIGHETPTRARTPFWKTRMGIIVIAVVAVVIVGAVVGGAVGATAGHHHSSKEVALPSLSHSTLAIASPTSSLSSGNATSTLPGVAGQGPATTQTTDQVVQGPAITQTPGPGHVGQGHS